MEISLDNSRLIRVSAFVLGLLVSVCITTQAFAIDNIGLFELDGNAADGSGAAAPDDWNTDPDDANGSAFVFTGITADPAPQSIFDGGKKDIQLIEQWSGKNGSVPDKGDITNAYAAAYKCPSGYSIAGGDGCDDGDLIAYFGADRFSNVGDTFLGFWFFKDSISYNPVTGEFDGEHMPGDTLVLVNFPQAENAVPLVQVVEWDTSCPKAANNNPQPGQCAAKNLRLKDQASSADAICNSTDNPGDQPFCAISNTEGGPNDPTMAYWSYTPKAGTSGQFPYESFFEGGVNLTKVIGGDACFASFMAESRSSSSFTASLKDFVLGQYPVCAVELSKVCGTGSFNLSTGNLDIPYSVTVKNTGQASVTSVVASDNDCGFGSGTTLNFGPLAAGAMDTKTGTCIVPVSTDLTNGITNGVSAIADGGAVSVILDDTICDSTSGGVCTSTCSFNLSPQIDVTKNCVMRLALDNETTPTQIVLKSHIAGIVTNTSDTSECEGEAGSKVCSALGESCETDADCTAAPVPLENVQVANDNGTTSTSDDVLLTLIDTCESGECLISEAACTEDGDCANPTTLEPGQSAYYIDVYTPTVLNDTCPARASFMDTVTAGATDVFNGASVSDTATAMCDLCDEDDCPVVAP